MIRFYLGNALLTMIRILYTITNTIRHVGITLYRTQMFLCPTMRNENFANFFITN